MDASVPESIGGYRIIELVGEGSMGRVYRARQLHPAREVALKLVSALGADAGLRLRREIEALARLEHPGIARLYAAGEEPIAGLTIPWLALEFVRGVELRTWLRTHAPDIGERVRLLIDTCRAVHYAHGRGIVHRDLKPANLMVDGLGQIKVLDFGIARLQDVDAEATRAGTILGSLPYMSPEQLGGDSAQVDARSDVYALGAIAYEMLSGSLPHPRLAEATLFEAIEVHRTQQPMPLRKRAPALPVDLEAVVMKALSAEPDRRYSSAAELAADLLRWSRHRPVDARPPTLGYVLSRFARRHRAAATAAALSVLALIVASAVSLHYALSEARARQLAEQRAAETEAVNGFLEQMLVAADPARAQGREVTVKDVLDASEHTLASSELAPAVRAMVQRTLAGTRLALGDYERALVLNQNALSQLADDELELRHGLLHMRASILVELGQFDLAQTSLDQADAVWPQAPEQERMRIVLTRSRLHEEAGRQAEAIAGYQRLVTAAQTEAIDPKAAIVEVARSNLIGLLRDTGQLDEALAAADAVIELRQSRDGDLHPRTLASRHARMTVLQQMRQLEQAAAEGESVLAGRRQVLGVDHAATLTTAQMLANIYLEQARLDEAEPLIRSALAAFESRFGERHAQTITSLNSLAYLLEAQGRVDEAEATYRRVLAIQRDVDSRHPAVLVSQNNLAMLLLEGGRLESAEQELRELLARTAEQLGDDHVYHAMFASNLGLCLSRMQRDSEAIEVLTAAHEALDTHLGTDHARTQAAAERLAEVQARVDEATMGGIGSSP